LAYEVISPQAFEGLRLSGRTPWRADATLATADHNVPTAPHERRPGGTVADPLSRIQINQLSVNCKEFGITEFALGDRRQGIIHVIGPEQGATLPGMTGDKRQQAEGCPGTVLPQAQPPLVT
jgi:3-isopropylmalate/(R)-2-methylmalate dehydratase large subunit